MLGRVLVLSASAGAGHLRAAEAIEKAIRIRGAATEVQHLDVLKYTNQVFRHFYSKAYIDLVNKAPEVLGWLYDYLDDPKKNDDPVRHGVRPPQCEPVHPLSPAISARRGDLHPFPAVGDHLLAEGGGEGQGLELGGGHRFRRPRDVALPACGAVLRRPGGDEGPPQGAGRRPSR